jgi:hypothetical protein
MGAALERLISAWRKGEFRPGRRNVLPGDEAVFAKAMGSAAAIHKSWPAFTRAHDATSADSKQFHLGLLPMPYQGNLRTAKVFLLSLNPGLGAHDYFGEHGVREYREELERNLRQDRDAAFPFLLPRHSWHGGSAYWLPRLRGIVTGVRAAADCSTNAALELCAARIAVLELVPYHSAKSGMSTGSINQLESARLMREFVFSELLPRRDRGDCLVVTLRAWAKWLPPSGAERSPAHRQLPPARMPLSARLANDDVRKAVKMIVGRRCNSER